ncbi:TPA: hypothetical protein MA044_004311 [Klebsiella pneumoniae]|nr:hypothetical protein [Klebsiella pneumoniae]HBT0440096.1 hypothetical protein [Klebsiella pneumoniae]HBZ0094255.1 hypothetical protein [Klebsiella pneumoniae]HDK6052195.1 hypothetical protein [Klebsiella variicola]
MTTTTEKPKKTDQDIHSCFVIMPIADMPGYESGHFHRVYNHLIKPACSHAGFKPIRADEVTNSNFIVLDILKRIVECDIAICDLSGRNPNVMYELGLRQAFNKKTVLIKDDKTISPFDVQAFRYCEYDSTMRIDNAQANSQSISKALTSTFTADENDVNSIVQLLKIQPAQVGEKTILSQENTLILKAIRELQQHIVPQAGEMKTKNLSIERYSNPGEDLAMQLDFYPVQHLIGNTYYNKSTGKYFGILNGTIQDKYNRSYFVFKDGNKLKKIEADSAELSILVEDADDIPF